MEKNRRAPFRLFMAAALILAITGVCSVPAAGTARAASSFEDLFAYRGLIKKGNSGDLVRKLQEALDLLGYRTGADGIFGDGTQSSLKKFQSDEGLGADGVAGAATLGALSREYYRKNPPLRHTVKKGETLSIIGERYAVSISDLVRLNGLKNADTIYVGQSLLLKEDPSKPAEAAPDPGTDQDPEPPVASLPAPTKRVCLSFNDGPDVNTTRQILSTLDTYGIKATFFLIGDRAAKNQDLVKAVAEAGHVIGVHGYEHKSLYGLSANEVQKDLRKSRDLLEQITGQRPYLYRPPGGQLDRNQVEEAEKLGLTTLMWTNIGGADLGAASAQEVASRVIQGAKDGAIILLHEGLQYTVEALPTIIETLARAGFGFQNLTSPPAR